MKPHAPLKHHWIKTARGETIGGVRGHDWFLVRCDTRGIVLMGWSGGTREEAIADALKRGQEIEARSEAKAVQS